jgi:hypothetical protein
VAAGVTRRRLKARRDRRGRPRKATARHRATTVAGRAAPPDLGTDELRRHRLAATTQSGLPDDLLGVLYGRAVIDLEQYTAGRDFSDVVRLVRLGLGLTEASPAGAWRNILSAASAGRATIVDVAYPGADSARRALIRFRRELGRASWAAVNAAADNIWPIGEFPRFVMNLRPGLDYLAVRLPLSSRRVAR